MSNGRQCSVLGCQGHPVDDSPLALCAVHQVDAIRFRIWLDAPTFGYTIADSFDVARAGWERTASLGRQLPDYELLTGPHVLDARQMDRAFLDRLDDPDA
ncbi:MAG: hypothetical protein J7513_13280 [Solirubrobacteraceae bacterium]|nr:hypothetical protein [Solirubrobacteraceae bacterium]